MAADELEVKLVKGEFVISRAALLNMVDDRIRLAHRLEGIPHATSEASEDPGEGQQPSPTVP